MYQNGLHVLILSRKVGDSEQSGRCTSSSEPLEKLRSSTGLGALERVGGTIISTILHQMERTAALSKEVQRTEYL